MTRKLQQATNIIGIGVGPKEVSGQLISEWALKLYVTRKLPSHQLSGRHCVPTVIHGISTDVVEVTPFTLHTRPVSFGASISHTNGEAGSLGCVVTRGATVERFILSASHVLAPQTARIGDAIVEPAITHGGVKPIATLADFEPLQPDGAINALDGAIAKLLQAEDVLLSIPAIGAAESAPLKAARFQSVRKFGAATLHTLGIITDVSADTSFIFSGNEYFFEDVFRISGCGGNFSEGGDSGALVVDALTNRPIGLIIGGAGTDTFASPIERLLERFDARMAS